MTDYITLADKTKIPLDEWYDMRSQHQTKIINRANRRVAKWEEFKALRIKHPDWPSQKLLKNIKQMHWTDLRDFKILYPDYDWQSLAKINNQQIAKGLTAKTKHKKVSK